MSYRGGRGRRGGGHWRKNHDQGQGGEDVSAGYFGGGGRGRGRGRRWNNMPPGAEGEALRQRSRFQQRRYFTNDAPQNDGSDNAETFARPRNRPPPGLRGKEIGLWYARQSKEKTKKFEAESRQHVELDEHNERHITNLLANLREADRIKPQPTRSYAPPQQADEDEEEEKPGFRSTEPVRDCWEDEASGHSEASCEDPKSRFNSSDEGISQNIEKTKYLSVDDKTLFCIDREKSSYSDVQPAASISSTILGMDDSQEEEDIESDNNSLIDQDEELTEEMFEDEFEDSMCEEEEEEEGSFMEEFHAHIMANRNSADGMHSKAAPKLERDPDLDQQLLEELHQKEASNNKYHNMLAFRRKLPSYNMSDEIVRAVRNNQVIVISGETGCGKTTQVPQFVLDDCVRSGEGSQCSIVCTQPRRISAIAVAERVAEERGENLGESVGYQIRLDARRPRNTQGSILYCTTGILLQWLASDPWLSKTTHVILDEIHERDILSDFLIIILRDLVARRPNLKVILMSATLNAEMFSSYFGNCPKLNIPGFTFPVKEFYLEDVVQLTRFGYNENLQQRRSFAPQRMSKSNREEKWRLQEEYKDWVRESRRRHGWSPEAERVLLQLDPEDVHVELTTHLVNHLCVNKPADGAILVFMPGWEQIKKVVTAIEDLRVIRNSPQRFVVIPLHSMLPTVNQKQVFQRPPPGVRKIIVATNIAETSITIDDVVYVIDCGKIKMKNFDSEEGVATLQPEWVSRANAHQRRGRAGRVQAGECYHLFSSHHLTLLADQQLPEMLRTRLEELCLQIKLLRLGRVAPFVGKAMQPPSMEAVSHALETLRRLGALDSNEELTPLGLHLAKMPLDPHTAKLLLFGAMFCCLDPALTIAASLSFKDAFYIPMGKERQADARRLALADGSRSDHIMLANAYSMWERSVQRGTAGQYCRDNFLSPQILKMLRDMRKQFAKLLCEMRFIASPDPQAKAANINSKNLKIVKAVLVAGLYPNAAKARRLKGVHSKNAPSQLLTETERRVAFHPKSVNDKETAFTSPWFIFHLQMKTVKAYLYDTTQVSAYPLLFFGGDIVIRQQQGASAGGDIVVDGWIVFGGAARVGQLVKELRGRLDELLQTKVTRPGPTDWAANTREGALMHAITDLLNSEPEKVMTPPNRMNRKHREDSWAQQRGNQIYGESQQSANDDNWSKSKDWSRKKQKRSQSFERKDFTF